MGKPTFDICKFKISRLSGASGDGAAQALVTREDADWSVGFGFADITRRYSYLNS